jgi:drug/metabolite transporter (DMT)-like permease
MSSDPAALLNNKSKAAILAIAAVGVASLQDAIVKGFSGELAASQVLFFRGLGACPLLLFMLWRDGSWRNMFSGLVRLVVARSALLASAYLAFIMSIAAMPIATSVSIYFTMPFFVAALAGPALGERVAGYRWLAIAAAFIGVMIMVQPGTDKFNPAMLLALYSALGYAGGQMIGRRISGVMSVAVISNWQNIVYTGTAILLALIVPYTDIAGSSDKALAFLTRPWIWPSSTQWALLLLMGTFGALGSLLFVSAYKHAEANYVAPFEYTALIWATLYGIMLFGDWPDSKALLGVMIVISAGLFMLACDARSKVGVKRSEARSTL